MRYYRIAQKFEEGIPSGHIDDMGMPFDEDGNELDPFLFTSGIPLHDVQRVALEVVVSGPPNDFILASFEIPIVHKRAIDSLMKLCPSDIQAIDVSMGFNDVDYSILNVLTLSDCIDRKKSRISYWKEEDGVPSKVGQFSSVDVLVIDPLLVGTHNCFRPVGWEVALLVSERVKEAFELLAIKGASFWPVSEILGS